MATTTAVPGLSPRRDGFHLDPPLYYPPTPPLHGNALGEPIHNLPFYRPLPSSHLSRPFELELGVSSARPSREELLDTTLNSPLSKRIHVIGFTQEAKFITHDLSAIPKIPPVRLFVHHPLMMRRWGEEGRSIHLLDTNERYVSSADILCPELIGPLMPGIKLRHGKPTLDYLDNVIVSTAPWANVSSLRNIRDRVDRKTTVCLLHRGLGLMEWLNERVFTDPTMRPRYILGHLTHKLAKHGGRSYTLKSLNEGKLYLYAVPEYETLENGEVVQSHQGMAQTANLIQLLSLTYNLGAVGLPLERFLIRKLPQLVFTSLADTISVILGCRFDQILNDHHAMRLWNSLLDEIIQIVCAFPEFQQHQYILKYFSGEKFRRDIWSRLVVMRDAHSAWITWIRNGHNSGVHFANGYFIKRAAELGLDHRQNSMALDMVTARLKLRRRELDNELPFGLSPPIMDGDKIGGGQIDFDPVLDDLESSLSV